MECKDAPAETIYDVLHDIEYRKKWDTNVIETFDIGKLTVNSDVGYYACEEGAGGILRIWGGGGAEPRGCTGSTLEFSTHRFGGCCPQVGAPSP